MSQSDEVNSYFLSSTNEHQPVSSIAFSTMPQHAVSSALNAHLDNSHDSFINLSNVIPYNVSQHSNITSDSSEYCLSSSQTRLSHNVPPISNSNISQLSTISQTTPTSNINTSVMTDFQQISRVNNVLKGSLSNNSSQGSNLQTSPNRSKIKRDSNLVNQLGEPNSRTNTDMQTIDSSNNTGDFISTTDYGHKETKVTFHLPPKHMNIPPDSSSENDNGSENMRMEPDESGEQGAVIMIKCRNPGCNQAADTEDARNTFKTCHNCHTLYCSRSCRRTHWERHRKNCAKIRANAAARQVVAKINEGSSHLEAMSAVARRGMLCLGRGVVKIYFDHADAADTFVSGEQPLNAHYLSVQNLMPNEMGAEMYKQITEFCRQYNPEVKFILYVNICVVNEVPTEESPKGRREMVSRCCKLRLTEQKFPLDCNIKSLQKMQRREQHVITRDMNEPETLVLASLSSGKLTRDKRHIAFNNINKYLTERGISLQHQFPDINRKLLIHVETGDHFPPVTIYPRDNNTNTNFMCILMPDPDPRKLHRLTADSTKIRTIDISPQ